MPCEICDGFPHKKGCPMDFKEDTYYCEYCDREVKESRAWEDEKGNVFCSEKCAEKYYGIEKMN